MSAPFEADLDPKTGAPRIRMNFENGWSVSIVLMSPDKGGTCFATASIAACPTGKWGTGKTALLNNEAWPDYAVFLIEQVAMREPLS